MEQVHPCPISIEISRNPILLEASFGQSHPTKLPPPKVLPYDGPEPEGKVSLTFDRSIFHPQGGGQPTDVGTVTLSSPDNITVRVFFVRHCKDSGRVLHDCELLSPSQTSVEKLAAAISHPVQMEVDKQTRRTNARIHSAGHLLDVAVTNCGYKWVPAKGYHFPDGAYVEYMITEEDKKEINADKAGLCKKLEEACGKLIEQDGRSNKVNSLRRMVRRVMQKIGGGLREAHCAGW